MKLLCVLKLAQLLEIYGRRLDNSDETESDVYDLHKMINMEREMSKSALKRNATRYIKCVKVKISMKGCITVYDELDLKKKL